MRCASNSAGGDSDAGSSDEEIIDSIRKKPASQASFTYLENTDELRRMIETGTCVAWRGVAYWLHPEQRRLLSANHQGRPRYLARWPSCVLRGAGRPGLLIVLDEVDTFERVRGDVLDWVDQFSDFDPERHYVLTIVSDEADRRREGGGKPDG